MTVKKVAPARRSAPTKAVAKVAVRAGAPAQSAAARKSAEAQLRALIDKFAPAQLRFIGAIRRTLLKHLPAAHELVYEYRDCFVISYAPNEHGYEGALAIRASATDVRLYFHGGNALPDPAKLLQGTAKARWIPLESAATLARAEVVRLISEAIARNSVPYARAGRGSMVIRPTAASQRGRSA